MEDFGNIVYDSDDEKIARSRQIERFRNCPIPDSEILSNLGLFLNSKNLSRILFFNHIYQQIIDVPGIIIDFGTRWGNNASILSALRGIYEPFNRHRKILAFDTFKGFNHISGQDGKSELMKEGVDSVTDGYEEYLNDTLQLQEDDNPLSHIKKFDVIKGDAVEQLEIYLDKNPQTIIAMAYFDFDLYQPTKQCLEMIGSCITKGSLIGFDELNDEDSPGETTALKEVVGLSNVKLKRYPHVSRTSYFIVD